jgi:aminopeptidase N
MIERSSKQTMSKIFSKIFCCLILFALPLPAVQATTQTLHHDLEISLFPSEKSLAGIDRLRVEMDGASSLSLDLSKKVSVTSVHLNGVPLSFTFRNGQLRVSMGRNEAHGTVSLSIRYQGIFDDPIPDAPLNTDDPSYGITGTISETGSFLQAGAGWYPEIPGSRPTYRLRVDAPQGVLAISEGKGLGHETKQGRTRSVWEVRHPVEGLSLSAAHYVVREKEVGGVRVATYFFPGSEQLSSGYIDATARYITLYENLFGPYPFDKFAVVENFFPTGYGFPSYTLLGSGVIRLPFIIHTSLGHEIAHCWWGNGVYTDYETGNWSEALTTYVADYLYKERASLEGARDYRLQALRKFSTLVSPQRDFPLKHFRTRYDPTSQAIGYSKGMMVFHMIRRLVGDEAFWGALRDIYSERLFKSTSWTHFQRAFERRGHRSLQGFFDQWLYQKGAPQLSLENVHATRVRDTWQVGGIIVQGTPYYHLQLDVSLEGGKNKVREKIRVSGRKTPFQISFDWPPERLAVDPNFDTFRQLYPPEIPPSINSIKGSPSVLLVIAKNALPGARHRGYCKDAHPFPRSQKLQCFL